MKAIICNQWGTPDELTLGDMPRPDLKAGHVRVRIHACSVNFADTLIIAGQYQEKPPFPFIPGMEAAGEVIELGDGVGHLQVGQRVAVLCGTGGFAEEVVANSMICLPIPDKMSYIDAASFMIAYGTSHIALTHRGQLQAGETLLVHGAAGGVGLTAVEIGHLLGANVIATASTTEKLELAKQYGADHLINYTQEDFRQKVKEITNGKGANVIYDPVGGDVFTNSLRCIAWEGRILVIGFASGNIPTVPANLTLVKNCSVVGVFWGAYGQKQPSTLIQSLMTLLEWYNEGKLTPHISHTYPLAQTAQAMKDLIERRAKGKVVVQIP